MLRWSINLFRLFGIQLSVHASFLLLLGWVAWKGWHEAGLRGLGWGLVHIVLLFTCVTLHEYGHSLVAQRFGIGVPRILLLPIGGMAQFDSIPRSSRAELWVTFAGPAVNFTLVALLWPIIHALPDIDFPDYAINGSVILDSLFIINLVMGCFNLLPVFPMDGGRILRALLALRWPYLTSTRWAVQIGKILAIIGSLVMAFVIHNYLASVIFLFILWAGEREYRYVQQKEEEAGHWAITLERLRRLQPEPPIVPPLLDKPRDSSASN